jgi:hypothetical protein
LLKRRAGKYCPAAMACLDLNSSDSEIDAPLPMEHDACLSPPCGSPLVAMARAGDSLALDVAIAAWLAAFGAAKPFTRSSERELLDAIRCACGAVGARLARAMRGHGHLPAPAGGPCGWFAQKGPWRRSWAQPLPTRTSFHHVEALC